MTHQEWELAVAEAYARKIEASTNYRGVQARNMGILAVTLGAKGRSHRLTSPEAMANILWKKAGGK